VAAIGLAAAQGRLRALAVAALALAPVALVSTAVLGHERWGEWLSVAARRSSGGSASVTAYQTLHSLFDHLLRYDSDWNPHPVADVPLLATALWVASAAAIAVVTVWAARAAGGTAVLLPLAILLPAMLLAAPVAEDQHFLILVPALVIAAALIVLVVRDGASRPAAWFALAAATGLLAPAWPYNRAGVEGWWTLLFYPRVYGALVLWALLVWIARRRTTALAELAT
jgi:hypothetical protein